MTPDIAAQFDLTGKTALITGGSRGLGFEMVRAFAAQGADIIIASRKLDACEAAARTVREMGRKGLAIAAHCGRWEDVEALIERAYEACPRIDILVNNAGSGPRMPSHEVTETLFDSVVSLNFKGPFRLASAIAHRMTADGGGGAIINISSTGALVPLPQVVPYSGAKAALNAMTVSLAAEYAPLVRVNAISAGPFLTDIAKAWPEEMRQTANNALKRPGQPEEIIGAALYLASEAGRFTTGTILRVDGGMA